MALRLMVEGCREKVRAFVDFLNISHQWRFYKRTRLSIGGNELRIDYFFDENPYVKPSISTRKVSKLSITSERGKEIGIILLDAEVIEMGNGVTYIRGKNFDIFASGKGKEVENAD
ncbi:hypothetical protein MK805_09560 [Shimazuella sp. AN120528]|uniref:hypothetical protein n=1 Tax=Shimazuella soli TaxID=1892854 RepID=UPI001F0DD185|nr:hypothetical protein [Shimazuella soli]MCH5585214.1 hypothetical protein [Shimazuella soli]